METPSDYALTGALALALYFFLSYGVASPWYRSALGIVTFAYAASASLLLSLVVFGVVFGSRVDEPWRLAAGLAIFLALAGKISVLHYERHKGRLLRSTPSERKYTVATTTDLPITAETVPPIWYQGKRVARTIVEGLVVLVPTLNLLALAIVDYLGDQADVVVPAWVFAALNGIIVATALLMGLVAKVMTVPGVNAWLVKIGLGSVPADEVKSGALAPSGVRRLGSL